jgi:hypothetical protein
MGPQIRIGFAVGVALTLSACGTLYKLDVTAYSEPDIELEKSYVVLSGSPHIDVRSTEFQEYANLLERALAPKGYRRVSDQELSAAALGIYVSVSVGDPSKRIHKVSTAMYETPFGDGSQDIDRSGGSSSGGSGQSGQQSVPIPKAQTEILTGYDELGFGTTVYTKHMNLVAIDLQRYIKDISNVGREKAVPKEVWSIDIETTGQPSDLADVVPVMVAAGQPYLGASTEDVVQIKINSSDSRIAAIKGGR